MEEYQSTASMATLRARAKLLQRVRAFFDNAGFWEVQTPLLSADTVVDRHLDPVPVLLPSDPLDLSCGREMFLQSSPEFAMKRLLASGADAIYQICPAFRIGESGRYHNPEFTMLEWYRVGETLSEGMQRLGQLASEILDLPAAATLSVSQACERAIGQDMLLLDAAQLQEICRRLEVDAPDSISANDWDTWFDLLFTAKVQPTLGLECPEIIFDYPASQSALARVRQDSGRPPVAERFELFVRGVELANGYHELLDADELQRRNLFTNQQRQQDGKVALPTQSRLLSAMTAGLPQCTGVALGFDRLLMLATDSPSIDQVIAFPIDRA